MMLATIAMALGIFGGSGKFVEIVQEVQVEGDYSPSVGRHPEPSPQPFVPVRYLTPEQRAEPIIVPPPPVIIEAPKQQNDNPNGNEAADFRPDQQNPTYNSPPAPTPAGTTPSHITSVPEYVDPPAGSATGSTAVADYGQ